MTTLTQTKKRIKPSRTLRLYPGSPMLLEMTIWRDSFSYWLRPIPSDFGQAFELRKSIGEGGEAYHVNLGADVAHSSCECQGFLRWNHCKHLDALHKLIAEGKLAGQPCSRTAVREPQAAAATPDRKSDHLEAFEDL
jgi:hypothetical protein